MTSHSLRWLIRLLTLVLGRGLWHLATVGALLDW
jgi:hypothetical protein